MPLDLQPVEPALLMCAVLASDDAGRRTALDALAAAHGSVRWQTPPYPFTFSRYYEAEMGPGLSKQLVGFDRPVDPAQLAAAKASTMALERQLGCQRDGGLARRANIDPGLLTRDSLILATTKYSGHRICIGQALYAELTLLYRKGAYRPFEWTYPDYQTPAAQEFLLDMRRWFMG